MRGIKGFTAVEVIKLEKIFGLSADYLMKRDDGQIFSPSKNSPFKKSFNGIGQTQSNLQSTSRNYRI